jgi:hypothetical protein
MNPRAKKAETASSLSQVISIFNYLYQVLGLGAAS